MNNFQFSIFNFQKRRGFSLIELIVAVGLFAFVMTLVSGAYIMMIGITRQAQGTATGIDNLSFALETMTRSIRTGVGYRCAAGDCAGGANSFSFTNANGTAITYSQVGAEIQQNKGGVQSVLTDPVAVTITSLVFVVSGTATASAGEYTQPHVTITISGTVANGAGKPPQSFSVETGATMRGTDL